MITDFTKGVDTIDLSSLDANTAIAGNQAFTFIDTAFTHVAGQLRFDSASHMLFGDVNGNGVADFEIELLGVTTLNPATDFIF